MVPETNANDRRQTVSENPDVAGLPFEHAFDDPRPQRAGQFIRFLIEEHGHIESISPPSSKNTTFHNLHLLHFQNLHFLLHFKIVKSRNPAPRTSRCWMRASAGRVSGARRSSRRRKPGLTRQALYHHFKSKEALFRAVIERLHESALAAEIEAASVAEKAGGSLADILVASISAKLGQLSELLDGSPHVEELFSEHLCRPATSTRNMPPPMRHSLPGHDHPRLPQARPHAECRHDAAGSCAVHRDGGQRHQVRLPRDAAGRRLPEGSGNHAAHARRRRHRSGAEAAPRQGDTCQEINSSIRPTIHLPQNWRSQMSTMTINGSSRPSPMIPTRC